MSTATRRDVRQAVALATELNLFSVTLHGVTWTLYHPGRQPRPGPQSASRDTGNNAATSRRSERSAARLRDFQAAQRFRLAHVFHRWKHQETQIAAGVKPHAVITTKTKNTTRWIGLWEMHHRHRRLGKGIRVALTGEEDGI